MAYIVKHIPNYTYRINFRLDGRKRTYYYNGDSLDFLPWTGRIENAHKFSSLKEATIIKDQINKKYSIGSYIAVIEKIP